jgi:LmbE family N-acetylglucosaminyl deacetylase
MLGLLDVERVGCLLCLGAHSDDIEIGCGGTILRLLAANPGLRIHWVVLGADEAPREVEAQRSAALFLKDARDARVVVKSFRNSFFPYVATEIKEYFETLKGEAAPDLIFTHHDDDRHQDHRLISELTWNTYRNHTIMEYEIFKYDGDLGRPNVFSPLSEDTCRRKIRHLMESFETQRTRPWFTEDVLWALLRLRGAEVNSPTSYAEAFHCRKLVL